MGSLPEGVIANMAFQMLAGLNYMKTHKRVHRDIKPENLLINSQGFVKLTDFGVSSVVQVRACVRACVCACMNTWRHSVTCGHASSFSFVVCCALDDHRGDCMLASWGMAGDGCDVRHIRGHVFVYVTGAHPEQAVLIQVRHLELRLGLDILGNRCVGWRVGGRWMVGWQVGGLGGIRNA